MSDPFGQQPPSAPSFPPPPPPPPPGGLQAPPGYVAYGGGGGYGAFGHTQNIGGLAKWTVGLLAFNVVMAALMLALTLGLSGTADDFVLGRNDSFDDRLTTIFGATAVSALVGLAGLVLLIITTFKISKNLDAMGRTPKTFAAGATIAINILSICTLNILNFFMWKELWKGSDPDVERGNPAWSRARVTPLLPIWLALSLLGMAGSFVYSISGFGGFGNSDDTLDAAERVRDHFSMIVLTSACSLVGAAVFVVMFRQLTRRHMRATGESSSS